MLSSLCQYWHLVYGILRRIKLLNTHLKVENFVNQPSIKDFNVLTLPAPNSRKQNVRKVAEASKQDLPKIELNICKLMVVYEKISDAVDLLNDLFGFNCALLIVGVLWHLIITFYGFIGEISGPRKDPFYLFMMTAWNFIHIMRLLFIAEPCYASILQIQQTKNLVCTLLSSVDVDPVYKPKFQEFALILTNRRFDFTATGLTTMDRSLVTSIIGAVTTYLVILLQFTQAVTAPKEETTTEVTRSF
ncbi:hypothetical protein ILUMI_09338 [Ignelater luminosus]|uniref:Gustatory receptor n=1 Tax=Ignelater luminosus TaxID=2038154 RepID=A0A8K0D9E7_IGNLU|nr:hypothetical protein ILUMI_09338 [Ignelater luminosus]